MKVVLYQIPVSVRAKDQEKPRSPFSPGSVFSLLQPASGASSWVFCPDWPAYHLRVGSQIVRRSRALKEGLVEEPGV